MSAALSQTAGRSAGLDAAAGDDAVDLLPGACVHARKLASAAPAVAGRSFIHTLPAPQGAARDARVDHFAGLIAAGHTVTSASAAMGICPQTGSEYARVLRKRGADLDAVIAKSARAAQAVARKAETAKRHADLLPKLAELLAAGNSIAASASILGHGRKMLGLMAKAAGLSPMQHAPRPIVVKASLTQRRAAALSSHEARRADKAEKTTQRNCLCCQKEFPSWGAGNRMCAYCRLYAE